MPSVVWGEIFKQLDFVSAGSFENDERNLGAGHTSDLLGELTGLMRTMRKLEAEHIAPESEGALEIRNRNAGVIGGEDSK
jgi:hypothetical protein